MSGHSKWAQIKRKKAAVDAKRGKVFTRLIREISVAARLGGSDEDANPRLRQAVYGAKAANMPSENIKRAIQRGTGELPGISYEEAVFEGYGPGGVAIMMEVMTDNRKRTVANIRHLMSRHGGNLGEPGCVSWIFDKRGLITVDREGVEEDELLQTVLDVGGEDLSEVEDVFEISSEPEKVFAVRDSLEQNGFSVRSAEISMVPRNTVHVDGAAARRLLQLMDGLEDHEDIQYVHSNLDVDETVLAEMD